MIYIRRGDDTDFNDSSFLTFNVVTEKDLTGWQAKFILNGLEKSFDDITGKSFDLHFSDEETTQFKLGKTSNELKLIDEEGKVKTVAKDLDIYITSDIVENKPQEINLPILKDEGIDINISLASGTGGTVNHNELLNRNLADQHKIGAITDLQETLDGKANKNEIPSLEGYVTNAELESKGYLTEHQDISNLAAKNEIPTKTSQLTNDSLFATESFVADKIAEAEIGGEIDLSGLATKEELNLKQDIITDLDEIRANASSAIKDVSNLATKDELTNKQDILVSGTNIKTINNESIIGSGNIEIKQSGGGDVSLPLASSFYFANIQPNSSFLKSSGQQNDGNKYKTFYDWLVEEKATNSSRTDIKDVSETYGDFDFVLNQSEKTFRLPLKNGSENLTSTKFDNLTLGATDTSYVAPANGWVSVCKVVKATNQYIQIVAPTGTEPAKATSSSDWLYVTKEVGRGETYKIQYTAAGDTKFFKFCYAKGNGDLYYYVGDVVN